MDSVHSNSATPESRDDLKRIIGIGPALERRLNDAGIQTFRQLLDWDAQERDAFSEALNFKGRMHRDRWLEQAAALDRGMTESNSIDVSPLRGGS